MYGNLRKTLVNRPENGSYRCGDLKNLDAKEWMANPAGTEWTRQLTNPAEQLLYQDDDAELFQWHVGDPKYDLGWYWCVAWDFVALPPKTYVVVHSMRPEADKLNYQGGVRVSKYGHHELITWWWGQHGTFNTGDQSGWAMNTIVVPADLPIYPPQASLPYSKVEELVQL